MAESTAPVFLARSSAATWQGIGLVATGAVGFSAAIIFIREMRGLAAPTIMLFRALSAFLFFSALLPRHPASLKVSTYRRSLPWLLGLGLAMGVTSLLYTVAVQNTTAANAVLLNNTATLYVALLAPWLLKETRPRYIWLSLALAVAGMICVTIPAQGGGRPGSWLGIIAAAFSGFSYAFTMLFGRLLRGRVGGVTQVWWGTGSAVLVALPWAWGGSWEAVLANWYWLLAVGIISLALPYFLYFQGLKRIKAQVVSVVALLEPVCGVLIGVWMYHEIPSVLGMVGIGMILLSIFWISRS
ncbi:MAG: EamA family transporter [Chloroflexota bacterium]|nr:EamA family transporter [Chloroflexota bacterium]